MLKHEMYIKRGRLGWKALPIMVSNELKALNANRQIIYSSLLSPVLYFLFYSIGIQSTFGDIEFMGEKVSFLTYSLIGIFAMCMFRQMYQCVYRMVIDKRWGLLSLKLLNGISPSAYILGISTFPIIGVLVQSCLLYVMAVLTGAAFPFGKFLIVLAFLVVCVLFWSACLICIALLIKDYKQRDFVMDIVMLPILFAAPLFYSFDHAPVLIKAVSFINPLSYQVQAMRSITFGIIDLKYIGIVILLAIVMYAFAVFCLSRTDFKNDEH